MHRAIRQVERLEFLATPIYRGGHIAKVETVGSGPTFEKLFTGNFFTFRILKNKKSSLFAIRTSVAEYLKGIYQEKNLPDQEVFIFWYSNSKKNMKYARVPNDRVLPLSTWLFSKDYRESKFVLSKDDIFVKRTTILDPDRMCVEPGSVALKMTHMQKVPTYEETQAYRSKYFENKTPRQSCSSGNYGCCPDNKTFKDDPDGENCTKPKLINPNDRNADTLTPEEQEHYNAYMQMAMPHRQPRPASPGPASPEPYIR